MGKQNNTGRTCHEIQNLQEKTFSHMVNCTHLNR